MLIYLIELRQRAIKIISVFIGLFILFFYFANPLFVFFVSPLLHALPGGHSLIATQVASPIFTPLKLAANLALIVATPFALWQFWQFIMPALYQREKQKILKPVLLSLLLFGCGLLFCFYLILPFMFQFFANTLPAGVKMMPDITNAIDFITRMLLIFGLCFQVPLICLLTVRLGWLSLTQLQQFRPYAIVGAFTIGMILTPPDVLSQVMLAVPLCLLYEFGIMLVRWQDHIKVIK